MPDDVSKLLWLLKLGALINLGLLVSHLGLAPDVADPHIVVPAQIVFVVCGYRCLFPNRYNDNVVLHATVLSSTAVTRVLATFAEVAWIYQFSHVLRWLNADGVGWVDALSWWMVIQVTISQLFVWGAILTGRHALYFYEEIGWAIIFGVNTLASAFLISTVDGLGGGALLLQLNLLFGAVYLPWQMFHLRALRAEARQRTEAGEPQAPPLRRRVAAHWHRALFEHNRRTDAASWGGLVGLTWMTAYWATLIPIWVDRVVRVASAP